MRQSTVTNESFPYAKQTKCKWQGRENEKEQENDRKRKNKHS